MKESGTNKRRAGARRLFVPLDVNGLCVPFRLRL